MQKKLLMLRNEADRDALLRERRLPSSRYLVDPEGVYLFYYSGKLHGWYALSWKKGEELHLKKYRGRTVFYYRPVGSPTDFGTLEKKKIFAIYKSENRPCRETILRIQKKSGSGPEAGRHFRVEWASPEAPELGGSHEVHLDECVESSALERLSLRPKEGAVSMNEVRELGEKLYRIFFPEKLRTIFETSDRIRYLSDEFFPLSLFRNGHFWGEKKIIFSHRPAVRTPRSRSKGLSLLLSGAETDEAMKTEYDKLGKMLSHSRRPLHELEGRFGKEHLSTMLERSWGLHFIGHGRSERGESGLLLGDGTLFGTEDLRRVKRVPLLLFLSSCRGAEDLGEWEKCFFEKGGRTLIRHRGAMPSAAMAALSASFYWQWMVRRTTAGRALLGARRKCLGVDLNWAFLELIGDPDLKL